MKIRSVLLTSFADAQALSSIKDHTVKLPEIQELKQIRNYLE
ncbi:hypothetical protein [Lysinibacillus sp. NPDC059133]